MLVTADKFEQIPLAKGMLLRRGRDAAREKDINPK